MKKKWKKLSFYGLFKFDSSIISNAYFVILITESQDSASQSRRDYMSIKMTDWRGNVSTPAGVV
jgi:hypothetical protein